MIEQYNNMVTIEPMDTMDTSTTTDEVSNTMNSQSTNEYSKKISQGIGLLLIHLGILLLILGLGSNFLFYILSSQLKADGKVLFDLMFNTECKDDSCSYPTNNQKGGLMVGGKNLEQIKKYLQTNDIAEKCHEFDMKFNRPKFSFNNISPSIKEWFEKANNDTNIWINNSLKNILNLIPPCNAAICSLAIIFGILFYFVFLILAIIPILLPSIFYFRNMYDFGRVGYDYFNSKKFSKGILTGGIIIYILFNLLFMLFNYYKSIFLFLKMLFYPLVLDLGITLLRILQNNRYVVTLITIVVSIFYIIFLSSIVEQNTYIGVLIAYISILLYTIKNLFNK